MVESVYAFSGIQLGNRDTLVLLLDRVEVHTNQFFLKVVKFHTNPYKAGAAGAAAEERRVPLFRFICFRR